MRFTALHCTARSPGDAVGWEFFVGQRPAFFANSADYVSERVWCGVPQGVLEVGYFDSFLPGSYHR